MSIKARTVSALMISLCQQTEALQLSPSQIGCMGKDGFFDDLKVWSAEPVK